MATVKSFTDILQSRKLAEFLPLESADMWYEDNGLLIPRLGHMPKERTITEVPCWSLASLLSVLPMIDFTTPQLVGTPKTLYRCMYNDNLKSPACDNAVDACYEIIVYLHEQNLL